MFFSPTHFMLPSLFFALPCTLLPVSFLTQDSLDSEIHIRHLDVVENCTEIPCLREAHFQNHVLILNWTLLLAPCPNFTSPLEVITLYVPLLGLSFSAFESGEWHMKWL